MRYIRFIHEDLSPQDTYGLIRGDEVMLIRGNPMDGAEETGNSIKLDEIRCFLPPVDPPNIFALGANYADHVREFGGKPGKEPVIFLKPTTAVIAHMDKIILPADYPNEVDYEAELAVIIGRTARNVSRSNALDYVLGYTCANDVSQRKCQKDLDRQWTRAKGFDTFCPLGPILATNIDPADLRVCSRLNGEITQDQSTADMLWDVPGAIELLSRAFTLLPGTVILTGTPAGVGGARTPPVYLRAGDRIEVEIAGIGVLSNTVCADTHR